MSKVLASSSGARTAEEIRALLHAASVPVRRADLLVALDEMRRLGLVEIDGSRGWRMARSASPGRPPPGDEPKPDPGHPGDELVAVHAVLRPAEAEGEGTDDGPAPVIEAARLLRYYEATQRADPRGAVTLPADRHGTLFQLFHASGGWWDGTSRLVIATSDLQPEFREALQALRSPSVALGYPLATLVEDGVARIRPVGLLAASAAVVEGRLEIALRSPGAALNPDWLRGAVRRSRWSTETLADLLVGSEPPTLDVLAARVAEALATAVRGTLNPGDLLRSLRPDGEAIAGAAALFLPAEASFTAGAARDLGALAAMPPARLRDTALGHVLPEMGVPDGTPRPVPVVNPAPLTDTQFRAAETALAGPLTVITGPPGTGKSQVILALVASALATGKTLLLASRNHQAIDAVEERLGALVPEAGLMVRARDRDGERDTDFLRIIPEILGTGPSPMPPLDPGRRAALLSAAARRAEALAREAERTELHLALSEHEERRAAIVAAEPAAAPAPEARRPGLFARLVRFLLRRRPAEPEPAGIVREGAGLAELDRAIARDRARLAGIAASGAGALDDIAPRAAEDFPALVAAALAPVEATRQRLNALQKDLPLLGKAGLRDMPEDLARLVLACRPIWAASALAVPARIPLHPGLFDYVVFDEASQCDIASALPLLARARRVVIVGDDRQLGTIPGLGIAEEKALLQAVGLPLAGMGTWLQSRNTLFEFADARPAARRAFLADQFRSAPAIVGYLNDSFYGGRLVPAADPERLRPPAGMASGIAWQHVPGHVTPAPEGGARNIPEAEAIADHLNRLLGEQGYGGEVGVISPLNAQVALLSELIAKRVPAALRERAALKVATVDRFQGGERDLILFSPVAARGFGAGRSTFLKSEARRFNVAISRARAVAHVFGDLDYALSSGIPHLARLAERATRPQRPRGGDQFDSDWERRVDAALRARGHDPQPQFEIAGRRLDFALFGANGVKLDLEIDGRRWHLGPDGRRKPDDHWRDHQLRALGWTVRRFWVHDLIRDMKGCLDDVDRLLGR